MNINILGLHLQSWITWFRIYFSTSSSLLCFRYRVAAAIFLLPLAHLHNDLKSLIHLFSSPSTLHATVTWIWRIHGTWLDGKYRVYVSPPQNIPALRRKKLNYLDSAMSCTSFEVFLQTPTNRQPPDFFKSLMQVGEASGLEQMGRCSHWWSLFSWKSLERIHCRFLRVFFLAAILFRRWSSGSIEIVWRGSSPKGGGSLAFRYVISPFPVFADNRHCSVACRKPGSSVSKTAATHGFED